VTKTFGDETFTLSEVVEPTERGVVFTCRVEITHTQDVSIDYDGTVSVRTRVLSTLDGEIEDVAAKLGQPASISCGFTTEDTDFRLLWNLDGEEYVCEDSGTEPDISCTANAANIVLQIENTTVLGEGFHTVQCILEPAIPPEFMDDPSFDPQFGENIVREATLTIIDPRLDVEYPLGSNRAVVRLLCVSGASANLTDARFFKDGAELSFGGGQGQVTVVSAPSEGRVTFSFSQEQEGWFSCQSHGLSSPLIGLAAQPDGIVETSTNRYVVLPSAGSSREIQLSCSIRPGPLTAQYSVRWTENHSGQTLNLTEDTYYLFVTAEPSSQAQQYQCRVTVQHRSDLVGSQVVYNGPLITVNKKVLSSIEGDIEDVAVGRGKEAEFKCQFSKDNSDVTVYWTVDGSRYDCVSSVGEIEAGSDGCYTAEFTSHLLIRDTESLATGAHPVQCFLQQNIQAQFKMDDSFDDSFNVASSNATLTVKVNSKPEGLTATAGAGIGVAVFVFIAVVLIVVIFIVAICWQQKCNTEPEDGTPDGGRARSAEPDRPTTKPQISKESTRSAENDAPSNPLAPGIHNPLLLDKSEPESVEMHHTGDRSLRFHEFLNDMQTLAGLWEILGLQLGFSGAQLSEIAGGKNKASHYLKNVLEEWLEKATVPCTKAELVKVLQGPTIRKTGLAKRIQRENNSLPSVFTTDTLKQLHESLTSDLSANYEAFGIQLGFSLDTIKELRHEDVCVSKNLRRMLSEWKDRGEELGDVISALSSKSVGQPRKANELEQKWRGCHCECTQHLTHCAVLNIIFSPFLQ
jgi:hypothetical protein